MKFAEKIGLFGPLGIVKKINKQNWQNIQKNLSLVAENVDKLGIKTKYGLVEQDKVFAYLNRTSQEILDEVNKIS